MKLLPSQSNYIKLTLRSPQGGAVLTATTSNVFKILNANSWTLERWTVLTGTFFVQSFKKNISALRERLLLSDMTAILSETMQTKTKFDNFIERISADCTKIHNNSGWIYRFLSLALIISGYLNAASWSGCGTTLLFTTSTESQIYCLKFTVGENNFRFKITVLLNVASS